MAQLVSGTFSVAVGGTAERITTDQTPIAWFMCHAHADNTGVIVVGSSDVVAAADETAVGVTVPESGTNILPLMIPGRFGLHDLYFDTTVNTDGINYTYLTAD